MSAPTVIAIREGRVAGLWGEPVRLWWASCPWRAEVHYAYGRSPRRPLVAVLHDPDDDAGAWFACRLSADRPSGFMGLPQSELNEWLVGSHGHPCLLGQVLSGRPDGPEGLLADATDLLLAERGLIAPGSAAQARPFAGSELGKWCE